MESTRRRIGTGIEIVENEIGHDDPAQQRGSCLTLLPVDAAGQHLPQ